MTRACIIIAFSYSSFSKIQVLEKICQAYLYFSGINPNRMVICSNIDITANLILGEDVGKLISIIKSQDIYHYYYNKKFLLEDISLVLSQTNEVIFYYIGNAGDGEIIPPVSIPQVGLLPQGGISIKALKDLMIDLTLDTAEILIISEGVDFSALLLPYDMDKSVFRLNFPKTSDSRNRGSPRKGKASTSSTNPSVIHNEYTTRKILCLSNTKEGIFKDLLLRSVEKIRLLHGCGIHASYPTLKYIWRWCIDGSNIKIKFIDNVFIISGGELLSEDPI